MNEIEKIFQTLNETNETIDYFNDKIGYNLFKLENERHEERLRNLKQHYVSQKIVDSVDRSGLDENVYPDAKVKTILEDLRACVYNYYEDLYAADANRDQIIADHADDDELPEFSITIKAVAN
jgi:hypothetical protein